MKFVILLCVLSCLLWECQSSPVELVENHQLAIAKQVKATDKTAMNVGRQQSSDDEEDDDDDDEDLESLVEDDDDDDDDDDEQAQGPKQGPQQSAAAAAAADADDDDDDDEDDYLERLFDDILDDDDDDDDDDDTIPSSGSLPQAVQAASNTPVAVVPQAVQAVADNADSSLVDVDTLGNTAASQSADYTNEGEQNVFYDEENSGIDTKVDIQSLNNKPSVDAAVASPSVVQKITAAQPSQNEIASPDSGSDDDDDDEDDDITSALDDEEDDEDDDEDDFIGDDAIEARNTHTSDNQNLTDPMADVLIEQYNHFVDGIFNRINRILKSSYDPVRVRLAVGNNNNNVGVINNSDKKGTTKTAVDNKKKLLKKQTNQDGNKIQPKNLESLVDEDDDDPKIKINHNRATQLSSTDSITSSNKFDGESTGKSGAVTPNQANKIPNKYDKTSLNNNGKQKIKQTSAVSGFQSNHDEKTKRAQGTLYGLASLRRMGNVKIIPQGNSSTIKSKFTLGPLTLRVEKSFKRGSHRSVKSATAKTNEMLGRINLRVVDGAATLVSIKVQQPKQVQVDSSDNHDRTREFVWKRTPEIAHLVSDKLTSVATETLMQPVGLEIVHL